MEAFFRRVKTGQVPGFPRFRSEERYNSFGIGRARIDGDRVNVPKLGPVRFKLYRSLGGAVRHVSIIRTARGWTLRVFCDLGDAPAKIPVLSATGIDVGLETFATLSNGERVENPRFFRVSAELIARRQRSLSSKKRGSNSRKAAKKLFARTHEHIRNQRLDFSRKLACFLFSRFDLIAYEDLQIARMAHGKLAKSIYDAAWGKTINALVCKAESAGKWAIATDPRGTSIDCSGCGQSVPKDLSQREHRCPKCGLVLHRDENAARNVLARGLRAGLLTEAVRQNPKEEISLVIQDA
jgi:putative transposase